MFRHYGFTVGLLTVLLLAAGCTEPADVRPASLVPGESIRYPEDEPPYIQVKVGEEWVEISDVDTYPAKPAIAPNGQRMAYISPYEFEMAGEVWLYRSGDRKAEVLLDRHDFAEAETPYQLIWLDDDRLAMVSGYQYGTVPSLRLLDEVDIHTGARHTLLELPERESILELALVPGGKQLKLTVLLLDEQYNYSPLNPDTEERWLDL